MVSQSIQNPRSLLNHRQPRSPARRTVFPSGALPLNPWTVLEQNWVYEVLQRGSFDQRSKADDPVADASTGASGLTYPRPRQSLEVALNSLEEFFPPGCAQWRRAHSRRRNPTISASECSLAQFRAEGVEQLPFRLECPSPNLAPYFLPGTRERPIQIGCGTDQSEMRKGLRKIP